MNSSPQILLLRVIAGIQMFVAILFGIYSLGLVFQKIHSEEFYIEYGRALEVVREARKDREGVGSIPAIAGMDLRHKSTITFGVCIVSFLTGCIQL